MTDDLTSGRRDRRVTARKTQIIEAAAQLFADKGFHRATTKDIANAADVSEGTLYNYFESKEQLLFSILTSLAESQALELALNRSLPEEPETFFFSVLSQRKEYMDRNRSMLRSVFSEILVNPELRERYYREMIYPTHALVTQHLQARADKGQIRAIDPVLAGRVISVVFSGLFFLDLLNDPLVQGRWAELSALIASMFFHGVAPPNGASTDTS